MKSSVDFSARISEISSSVLAGERISIVLYPLLHRIPLANI